MSSLVLRRRRVIIGSFIGVIEQASAITIVIRICIRISSISLGRSDRE